MTRAGPATLRKTGCLALLLWNAVLASAGERVVKLPLGSPVPDDEVRSLLPSGEVVLALRPHAEGELLVRFKDGTGPSAISRVHARLRAAVVRRFGLVRHLQLVRLPPTVSVAKALGAYRGHPDVEYAEPNWIVRILAIPNDPLFPELWGLQNTGQNGGTPGADIDAPQAWNLSTGSASVVVAVIDTGIDYTHPDLAANMWTNTADCNSNGIDDDGNGYADDCYGIDTVNNDSDPFDDEGHGTHVAGTIGALGNNGVGVAGVNWDVSLMACKFLDASGSGTVAGAVGCLDYVKTMKDRGVNVVATNASWGSVIFSQALFDAIDAHRQRGILLFAAAGNNGLNNDTLLFYPASYDLPNVISVAATDRLDNLAYFSNYGKRTVHLGAPGDEIVSTFPGNLYAEGSGTSMATPHVTGVAALLKARNPALDWRAIKNLILAGGDTLASLSNTVTQKRLNAYGAMTCPNSTVLARLQPTLNTVDTGVGAAVLLRALHINCANPNGDVNVVVNPGNQIVTLRDDGLAPDQVGGDGVYSGQWTPAAAGTYGLTFPGGDVVAVNVDADLKPGFPVKTFHGPGTYQGGQAIHTLVGNIDGDPDLEIIVTGLASGPLYAWKSDGSLVPGWPVSGVSGAGYPVIGNLSNAFPGGEVFSGHWGLPGKLTAYSGSGSALPGWPRNSANYVTSPPSVVDVDGDGVDEMFIAEEDWQLHAYRADGSSLPGWPVYVPLGGQERHTPAIADLDGDGQPEIVTASGSVSPGGVYLFAHHLDGTLVPGFPISFGGFVNTFPVIGDVDGDGAPEIIVPIWGPMAGVQVLIFSADGQIKRTLMAAGGGSYGHAPALADLDGDCIPEIILQTDGALNVWKGDGSVFPGWPVALGSMGNSSPVVGDVDGDGLPDIVVTTDGGKVWVYNRNGVLHPRFPKTLPLGSGAVPAIADLDLDGRNEIIVSGSFWSGIPGYYDKVWVYDLGGPQHGPIHWGQFMGGPHHQGRYSCPITGQFTLTVTKAGTGSGKVTSNPSGIDCGSDCSETYASGTPVALNASPDPGSTFAGWSGHSDCADGQVTMNAHKTCTATFTTHTLSITGGPSGSPNPVASEGTATLSVSAVDSLSHPLGYQWAASCPTLGGNGSFSDPTAQNPSWTAPTNTTSSQQSCTLQVTVDDGQGLSQQGSFSEGVTPAGICPATAALEGAPQRETKLRVLYRFRDQVLARSATGQRYIQLFYTHAVEGVWLMARHRELRASTRILLERFLPTVQAVLARQRAVLTSADLAAIESLIEAFRAKAGGELRADLQAIREDLRRGAVLAEFGVSVQRQAPSPRR